MSIIRPSFATGSAARWRGATTNAARALGLKDRGTLEPGKCADFVVWDVDHPAELCYWIGGALARRDDECRASTWSERSRHAGAGQVRGFRGMGCRSSGRALLLDRRRVGAARRRMPREHLV